MERLIDTMPNLRPDVLHIAQTHIVSLPQMCPVSGNPQSGSYVAVRYVPASCYLEVYSFAAYLRRYVGGWLRGDRHIRDMEQVVATIAADCAAAVSVPVRVRARLVLDTQRLTLTVEARSNVLRG